MTTLTRRERESTPGDSLELEAFFQPEPKPAPKLYYRLFHDDIWPTTEDPAGALPIGESRPVKAGFDIGLWAQIKAPFVAWFAK